MQVQKFRLFASLTLLVALFLAPAAHAGAIDQLHAFATQTRSAKGEFSQQVQSRTRKAVVSTGDFLFARPGKFRWAYLKPYEQLIVADGTRLTIYDRDLNQATVRKLDDALGATPAAILFGNNDFEKRFDLKDSGTRDGVEWLDAVPKTRDTTFERIGIGFRNGELAAMELRDALGQVTMLTFSKIERNVAVTPDSFRFTPPKGADVLEN